MTTVLNSLNQGLHQAFQVDERVYLLGEDILDPYGGAFKTSKGLSQLYPDRVIPTPISEAGITGIAAGMALRGLLPVVEIMFGDFLTLTADQIVNHMAKFRWMYNDQVKVPVVIRTPMGGRRGYGPTHSQSIEKLLLGIPGLRVLSPTHFGDPGELLAQVILEENDPVLFIENKLLYLVDVFDSQQDNEFEVEVVSISEYGQYPAYRVTIAGAPEPEVVILAYGHMAKLAQQAMLRLAYESEIFSELIVLTEISPLDLSALGDEIGRCGRVVVVEEGTLSFGWGAEVLAQLVTMLSKDRLQTGRVAAVEVPIPASKPLEDEVLPTVDDIIRKCRQIIESI